MARMIEGCNAISVLILFVSFVFLFLEIKKKTVFMIMGVAWFYFFKCLRIAILCVLMFHFPERKVCCMVFYFLYLFMGFFLLWLLWINKYANDVQRNS
jgi:exosortase family protein XrtF